MKIIICTFMTLALFSSNAKADWRDAVGAGAIVGGTLLEMKKEKKEKEEREKREKAAKEKRDREAAEQRREKERKEAKIAAKRAARENKMKKYNAAANANTKMPKEFGVVLLQGSGRMVERSKHSGLPPYTHYGVEGGGWTELVYAETLRVPLGTIMKFSLSCSKNKFGDKHFSGINFTGYTNWHEADKKPHIVIDDVVDMSDALSYGRFVQIFGSKGRIILNDCKVQKAQYVLP